jgi:hypothetical protein
MRDAEGEGATLLLNVGKSVFKRVTLKVKALHSF